MYQVILVQQISNIHSMWLPVENLFYFLWSVIYYVPGIQCVFQVLPLFFLDVNVLYSCNVAFLLYIMVYAI
jgi:hypothetical protein